MTSEARTFGLAMLLTVGGMAVMLYGVTLNHGEALNVPIAIGGVVLLIAIGVLTAGIMGVGPAPDAHD